ncbi:MAG TPA: HDIG domain-containing protein [Acidimicrobiia bacterium]|nr:HDIG domain-containing protein [Acidimicrobiia bacterium]
MSTSTWRHLAARLIDYLTSSALDGDERTAVQNWLRPGEAAPFFAQSRADQRHGREAALGVQVAQPERTDLIRAALLHDIGKRHSRVGAIARSIISAWAKVGGRVRGRAATYLDHGPLGADELALLGAEELVIDFARHHHSARPPSISAADWALLQQADSPRRKTPGARREARQ